MIKLGGIQLGDGPRIAVAVSNREPLDALADRGIDVLELRVDQFADTSPAAVEEVVRNRTAAKIPIILTVRNDPAEGGVEGISDEEKWDIFTEMGEQVDGFDIELSSPIIEPVIGLAEKLGKPAIASKHNFQSTPSMEDLEGFLQEARDKGADIFKFAAMPADLEDVRTMLTFTMRHRSDRIITMSLGAVGAISRVLFSLAGSLLTYSYIDRPSAPGQIALERLQEQLRMYSPEYEKHWGQTSNGE